MRKNGWKPAHIRLADEAALFLVAPATANVMAKLAHGMADDALSCIALALNPQARILLAPAMNGKMWHHPATQQNLHTLRSRGVEIHRSRRGHVVVWLRRHRTTWPVEGIAQHAEQMLL